MLEIAKEETKEEGGGQGGEENNRNLNANLISFSPFLFPSPSPFLLLIKYNKYNIFIYKGGRRRKAGEEGRGMGLWGRGRGVGGSTTFRFPLKTNSPKTHNNIKKIYTQLYPCHLKPGRLEERREGDS